MVKDDIVGLSSKVVVGLIIAMVGFLWVTTQKNIQANQDAIIGMASALASAVQKLDDLDDEFHVHCREDKMKSPADVRDAVRAYD